MLTACSTSALVPTPFEPRGAAQSQIVDTLRVGPNPTGVIATKDAVYIANNTQTGPSSVGMLLLSQDGKTLYALNSGISAAVQTISLFDTATLYLVSLESGKVLKNISVERGPDSLALSADAKTLYCANVYANSVSVIDTASKTVTKAIHGVWSSPSGIAMVPNGTYAYVTNFATNTVSVIQIPR